MVMLRNESDKDKIKRLTAELAHERALVAELGDALSTVVSCDVCLCCRLIAESACKQAGKD